MPPFNLQYIGEIKRRLKDRFNEHKRNILNPSGELHPNRSFRTLSILSNSHSVSHMLLIPIETLRYERDCLRKARKGHLIHKAKTRAIMALGQNHRASAGERNKRDEL